MKQAQFDAKINGVDMTIVFQHPGNFKALDLMGSIYNAETGALQTGEFVKKCCESVCVQPKNMVELLEESEDLDELTVMANLLKAFLKSPSEFRKRFEKFEESEGATDKGKK